MSDKNDDRRQQTPKPTEASENISHGEGSVNDIQDVAQDSAEGHAPPVQPQPSPQVPDVSKPDNKR